MGVELVDDPQLPFVFSIPSGTTRQKLKGNKVVDYKMPSGQRFSLTYGNEYSDDIPPKSGRMRTPKKKKTPEGILDVFVMDPPGRFIAYMAVLIVWVVVGIGVYYLSKTGVLRGIVYAIDGIAFLLILILAWNVFTLTLPLVRYSFSYAGVGYIFTFHRSAEDQFDSLVWPTIRFRHSGSSLSERRTLQEPNQNNLSNQLIGKEFKIYDDKRLAFKFDLPLGIIKTHDDKAPLHENPMIVFMDQAEAERGNMHKAYFFNLVWGPLSGKQPSVPVYWRRIGKIDMDTPDGEIPLLIGSNEKFLPSLLKFGLLILLLWSVVSTITSMAIGLIAAIIAALFTLWFLWSTTTFPQVKYVFLYDQIEYVFTVNPSMKELFEETILRRLKFRSISPARSQIHFSQQVGFSTVRLARFMFGGVFRTIMIAFAIVVLGEALALFWPGLTVLLYTAFLGAALFELISGLSMYLKDFRLGDEKRVRLDLTIAQVVSASALFVITFALLCRALFLVDPSQFTDVSDGYAQWMQFALHNLIEGTPPLNFVSALEIELSSIQPSKVQSQSVVWVYRALLGLFVIATIILGVRAALLTAGYSRNRLRFFNTRFRRLLVTGIFWVIVAIVLSVFNERFGGFQGVPDPTTLRDWITFAFYRFFDDATFDAFSVYGIEWSSIVPSTRSTQIIIWLLGIVSSFVIVDSIFGFLDE